MEGRLGVLTMHALSPIIARRLQLLRTGFDGYKHVLGLSEGASENTEVVVDLLEDLVARGVNPKRRRLFVIDGSQALRKAIDQVFGAQNPVQRCRAHKLRNVLGYLLKDLHEQTRVTLKAAWRLAPKDGIAKLKQ